MTKDFLGCHAQLATVAPMVEEHTSADVARMLAAIERARVSHRRHSLFAGAAWCAAAVACTCLIAIMLALASWSVSL